MNILRDLNVLFVHGFVIYFVTSLSNDVGELQPAYTSPWYLPVAAGLLVLIPFWLGYFSGKKSF